MNMIHSSAEQIAETLALVAIEALSVEDACARLSVDKSAIALYAQDPTLMAATDTQIALIRSNGAAITAKSRATLFTLLGTIDEAVKSGELPVSMQVRVAEMLYKLTGLQDINKARAPQGEGFSLNIYLSEEHKSKVISGEVIDNG